MGILYKLMRQDPNSREGIIAATSGLNIIANVLVALTKIVIGLVTSSVAIMSEGINNASDVLTSVLALLGAKLAKKHPDDKHPFGYGRIEYLASLVIATIIVVAGFEMLKNSVELIFHPAELKVSYVSIAIVAVSAVVKYILGTYTIAMGKKTESNSLIGVGAECRGDSFASVIIIVSSVIFLVFHKNVDAFAGVLVSVLIMRAGFEVLQETVGDLLGRAGEEELAKKLYKEIRNTEGIYSAADMMLHNYGPDDWSGSVNVEIDHKKTVGEIYEFLHELQLRIMHEYHVTMVFGIYAVDNDSEVGKELRKTIAAFTRNQKHVKSFHAVYRHEETKTIYCDFIVDYDLEDWDGLRAEFKQYMDEKYPDYSVELVVETEFV